MPDVILSPLLIQFDGSRGIVAEREVLPALIPHDFLQLFRLPVPGPGGFDFSQHSQSVDSKQFELFDRHVTHRWSFIAVYRRCAEW